MEQTYELLIKATRDKFRRSVQKKESPHRKGTLQEVRIFIIEPLCSTLTDEAQSNIGQFSYLQEVQELL